MAGSQVATPRIASVLGVVLISLSLDIATSTGWSLICDGDVTQRNGHWQLFAAQKLRKWRVNWRYFPETNQSVGWGFWDLKGSEYAPFGYSAGKLLACLLELNKFVPVDRIFWEQRFPTANFNTGDLLATLGGAVAVFCFNRRPRVVKPVANDNWAPHFIGRVEHSDAKAKARRINKMRKEQGEVRKVSARNELKSLSVARARLYGFTIERDDEADALGMLDYGLDINGIIAPWRIGEVLQPTLMLETAP